MKTICGMLHPNFEESSYNHLRHVEDILCRIFTVTPSINTKEAHAVTPATDRWLCLRNELINSNSNPNFLQSNLISKLVWTPRRLTRFFAESMLSSQ